MERSHSMAWKVHQRIRLRDDDGRRGKFSLEVGNRTNFFDLWSEKVNHRFVIEGIIVVFVR